MFTRESKYICTRATIHTYIINHIYIRYILIFQSFGGRIDEKAILVPETGTLRRFHLSHGKKTISLGIKPGKRFAQSL